MVKIMKSELEEIVEKFMKETRIKEYCTKVCKGACCREIGCQECILHSRKQPLSCKIFICESLCYLLGLRDYQRHMFEFIEKNFEKRWKNEPDEDVEVEINEEFLEFLKDSWVKDKIRWQMTRLFNLLEEADGLVLQYQNEEMYDYLKKQRQELIKAIDYIEKVLGDPY